MAGATKTDARHAAGRQPQPPKKRHRLGIAAALVAGIIVLAFALPPSHEAIFSLFSNTEPEPPAADASPSTDEPSINDAAPTQPAEPEEDAPADNASAEEEEPQERTSTIDTSDAAQIETLISELGVRSVAPAGFTSTESFAHLEEAIRTFEAKGYNLGFSLMDMSTGREITYNTDELFYPASSVKALYCTAILESTGGQAQGSNGGTIQNCLVNSDNDAFRSLLKTYGWKLWGDWLSQYEADAGREAYTYNYPHMSAAGMRGAWEEIYRYGLSGEAGAEFLTSCLARTNHSAWGALLRGRYTVWSKPGWYPVNEGLAQTSTVDAGVIFSDCGDYVVAVLSDAPEDFASLIPVLDALNAAHGEMCGGSIELVQTGATTVG